MLKIKTIALVLFVCVVGFSLCACGKKATEVVLSDDGDKDGYPRTYPDSKTDPTGNY